MDKFSPVHFAAPGNNFVGGIFRLTTKSLTGDMHITLWSQPSKNCNKQVRGIYFNSQRGKRVRPLDPYTLELLKQTDPLYAELQIQGGLYTSCAEDDYSIFGQITYNRSWWTTSTIIAGTNLDYLNNTYGQNNTTYTFANSFQYFDNKTPIGYIWDSYGGIGFVGGEMTWSADLIAYLNNNWTINDAFQKIGTGIVSTTGSWLFTGTTTGNNASNIIRNLMVQGSVWLSPSMNEKDIIALLGNPQEKTVIMWTENINNATLINQAKQNMETLCKGKNRSNATSLSASNDDVLCFENTNVNIELDVDEPLYHNKTIIMRSGSIILSGSMEDSSAGLDLLIDQWNLYLKNNPTNMLGFDNQWYVSTSASINSWTLLRGTIIINGLLLAGQPWMSTGYSHKLYIQGKISSLNTPFAPTTARIGFVEDVLWTNVYDNRINLQNVFVRTCFLNGMWSDGSSCADSKQIASIPLVIVDGKYPSRLLNN